MKLLHLSVSIVLCICQTRHAHGFAALAPTADPQLSFPAWNQHRENYLKIHQRVNRRKAFGRLLEISRVLSGRVLFPLVCSLIKDSPVLAGKDWDDFWAHKRGLWTNAERVALGLPSLGPSYVKLAQALATRPDILHVPLADALGNLHDSLASFDDQTAKRIIRRESVSAQRRRDKEASSYLQTDEELGQFLDSLSDKPVAAGSIAQVYKAHLPGCTWCPISDARP